MSEIVTAKKTPAPIVITEDIQVSLNRLGRDLETHAESGIRIGKELIYLKEITPHGKFGELVEWAYGLKEATRIRYMQVAEKFGENLQCSRFSQSVLIELSKNSVPDSAREESISETPVQIRTVMLALRSSLFVGLSGDLIGVYESISMLDILHKQLTGKYFFVKEKI